MAKAAKAASWNSNKCWQRSRFYLHFTVINSSIPHLYNGRMYHLVIKDVTI